VSTPPFPRNPLVPFDPAAALARVQLHGPANFAERAIVSTSPGDIALIHQIVNRFVKVCERYGTTITRDRGAVVLSSLQLGMDLCLCHHRTPLRLHALLMSDDDTLTHDIVGIFRDLDRLTGELREGFKPRTLATPD
jgi:hypothetical protein